MCDWSSDVCSSDLSKLPPPNSVETRLQSMERQGRICRVWNASKGAVAIPECGGNVAVRITPPTQKGSKCRAKNQMWRNAREWGASGSPCLKLSSSTAPTTKPCRYPTTALYTATFRIAALKHTNATKRRSSTTRGSTIGRTAKHSRYSSASIGCPKIGLGALRKLNGHIPFPLLKTQKT